MTQESINKTYLKLKRAKEKAATKLDEFSRCVSGICEHPDEFLTVREKDVDNGYGGWWKIKIRTCQICGYKYGPYDERFR